MKKLVVGLISFYFCGLVFGEVIELKSGRTVEGKIIERTNESIKVDIGGMPLTYYLEDIESINGRKIVISISKEELAKRVESCLQQEGLTMKDLEDVTGYYYQNPQPDKLFLILKAMLLDKESINSWLTHGEATREGHHYDLFVHIFAIVAHNDSQFLNRVKNIQNNYSGIQQEVIRRIINQAENFQSPPPKSPHNLDCLWAEFIMTGSEEPVKKIISVLGQPDIRRGDKILAGPALTKAAAEWSLGLNSKQHKKVYEIIKKESILATGVIKEKLENILEHPGLLEYSKSATNEESRYYEGGLYYYHQGEYEKAINEFKKVTGINPNDVKAYRQIGYSYLYLRQPENAITYLQRTIELDPDDADVYSNLGVAYGMLGQYEKSISYLKKAVEKDPFNASAYSNLGYAYIQAGQSQNAIEYLKKAKELFQQRGDYKDAQKIEEYLKRIP